MCQLRDRAGFPVEPLAKLSIGRDSLREHFDRNDAIEARIASFVNLTHAASAQRADDFIWSETDASRQTHLFDGLGRAPVEDHSYGCDDGIAGRHVDQKTLASRRRRIGRPWR